MPRRNVGTAGAPRSECPVCFHECEIYPGDRGADLVLIDCPKCKRFKVSGTADSMLLRESDRSDGGRVLLGPKGSRKRANASAWLRANAGSDFTIFSNDVERLATIFTPSVSERTNRLLAEVSEATDVVGKEINIGTAEWVPKAWALNRDELIGLAEILQESELLDIKSRTLGISGQVPVRVTAKGWAQLEEMTQASSISQQGFVAMWFRQSLTRLYADAIEPAIRAAGYSPFRVDSKPHIEKIDDRIMAEIRRSRFVVADYTGHRGGVYYETGFAHGLGKPVFFTCCKRHMKDLHFDIRQYNCIGWINRSDLRQRLTDAIVGVIGQGPLDGDEIG